MYLFQKFVRVAHFAAVFVLATFCSLTANALPNIPDYLDSSGIPVYEVNAASTDGFFTRTYATSQRVGAAVPESSYNCYSRYTDGKYEKGFINPNGIAVMSGNFLDSLSWLYYNVSDMRDYHYYMCGSRPSIVFTGYWQNWEASFGGVLGATISGSDFTVTGIDVVDGGECGFP